MFLPRLTVLNEQYAIGRPLGSVISFVASYQAWDLKTEDQVELKEYFPSTLAVRAEDGMEVVARKEDLFRYGRDQFLKEAQVLAAIAHPNLLHQIQCFEANNTAYRAMVHYPGASLTSVLQKKGGKLPLKTAVTLMMPVLEALQAAHRHGLLHGAISPRAVFLSKANGPILCDFRTAHIMLAQRMGTMSTLVEEGMVAPEQHQAQGQQGPWTDVYGAAAMLYEILTGQTLPAGPDRIEQDDVPRLLHESTDLTAAVRTLFEQALSLDSAQRPRSVQAFQHQLVQALEKKKTVVSTTPPASTPKEQTTSEEPTHGYVEEQVAPVFEGAVVEEPIVEELIVEEPAAEVAEPPVEEVVVEIVEDDLHVDEVADAAASAFEEEEASKLGTPVSSVLENEVPSITVDFEPASETVPLTEEPDSIATGQSKPTREKQAEDEVKDASVTSTREWAKQAESRSNADTKKPAVTPKKEVQQPESEQDEPTPKAAPSTPLVEQLPAKTLPASGPTKPKQADQKKGRKPKRHRDRTSKASKKRFVPVMAALLVVTLVAVLGAFAILKDDSGAQTQFAYYKTQGDSLFALANYADAKAEYERALSAMPQNTEVAEQLDATNERLAEVSAIRYEEHLAAGDLLYAHADSLLKANRALEAASYYNEANKAYYEALRYRPDDPAVLEKGQLTADGMDQALNLNIVTPSRAEKEETERVDPATIRKELYDGYRQEGDVLFQEKDYLGAQEQYRMALSNQPGDVYASNMIKEVETLLEKVSVEEQYRGYITRATSLCDRGRCAEARVEFQRALDLKPESAKAQAGIAWADSMMASVQRQDQQYQYHRGQGDAMAAKGNYKDAVSSYEQALTFKPGDAYVEQQLNAASNAATAKEEALTKRNAQDGVYKVADQAPQLIGGLSELHKKVQYPQKAYDADVTGRVYVQFIVNEQGRVENAKVVRGIGSGCDEEALRVVQQARFEAGKVDGQPVKVHHTLFINFAKTSSEEE